jgi:hypothetical protein
MIDTPTGMSYIKITGVYVKIIEVTLRLRTVAMFVNGSISYRVRIDIDIDVN